jgi:hypothetical protein
MGNPFQSTAGQGSSGESLQQMLSSFTNGGSSTTTPNQNPIFQSFQQSLLPAISAQYEAAQAPVYGNAQIAQVANQGNQATQAAEQANKAAAARSGTLNAGNTQANNTSLQQGNVANTTNFENQIPMLNQQAKFNNTQNLLGLATSFLGQSPIGQTTTSANQGTNTSAQVGTNTSTSSGWGNPSILQGIGQAAGAVGAGLS